ncbi:MAG: type II secretion system F family protein [Oliverpabstia sp.]
MKTDYSRYYFSVKEWIQTVLEIAMLTVIVDYLCYRSFWFLLMGIPAGIWYIRWKKKEKIDKRKKRIAYHFQDVLHGLQTAVRAGYAMERAVTECRKELEQIYGTEDELVKELVYMERQMKVGVGVDQLFLDLGLRTGVEDILNFGEIFMISRKSGGNLGDIMEKMARIIGEKIRVSREIDVAISGKKMEQLIMSLVPGGMILYMQASSRGFMDVLYHNPAGVFVMTICLCVYGCSFYMGRKIVRIAI